MINGIPGFFISGENRGEAARLRYMHEARAIVTAKQCGESSRACAADAARLSLKQIQNWLWETNLPPPVQYERNDDDDFQPTPIRVTGFKEVRWRVEDVEFIRQACPCSRFVINVRKDVQKQLESAGMFSGSPDALGHAIDQVRRIQEVVPEAERFQVVLEELNVENMNKLVRWLGVECVFSQTTHAHQNSSYSAGERVRCRP